MNDRLSSDPNAWLFPFYADLKRTRGFARLAPALRIQALADTVQAEYPARAAEIRKWNRATQDAMLQGGEFFASSSNPTATWRSTKVTQTSPGHYRASGTLTIRGKSHPQAISFTLATSRAAPASTALPSASAPAIPARASTSW